MKIIRSIRNVFALIRRLKRCTETLSEYLPFLESGSWYSNKTGTVFYKKGCEEAIKKTDVFLDITVFQEADHFTRFVMIFLKKFFRFKIHTSGEQFLGQVLITTSMGTGVRIVNFEELKLLSVYRDRDIMETLIGRRLLWSKYFKTIPLYSVDLDAKISVERYVIKKDCDVNLKYQQILFDYIEYSKKIDWDNSKESLSDELKKNVINLCKKIGAKKDAERAIEIMESNDYKFCLNHGDLTDLNVIYDGKVFYYIDFDFTTKKVFFYDVLSYICWLKRRKNIPTLVENYFEGKYDDSLSKIFESFGVSYRAEDRKAYLIIIALTDPEFKKRKGWFDTSYSEILQMDKKES